MEKNRANTKSTAVCERICKAVAGNGAFRAIRRISSRSSSLGPSKKRAKPAVVSAEEKVNPNQKAEKAARAPSEISHGQGVYVKPKVEPAKPHMPVHEELKKPKDQPASTTKKTTATARDDEVGEGKKAEVTDGAEKFSAYINYVRNKFRTKSDIGEEKPPERPPIRTATRRDSFNDRVSHFINRARKNMRTTSNVGDG